MVKYMADNPISVENKAAVIQVIGCIGKNQEPLNFMINEKP